MMKVDGACHCGAITVEGEIDPERVTICHCTDCQTSTGSAFRVSVPVAGEAGGTAVDLREDHGGERQSAHKRFLPDVRLADLFERARRRPAGIVYAPRRHSAAA